MQSWSLERKIQVTQTRIMEWYMRWNGQIYVSFSGGKDSTVLLDLARRVYPNIEAVFVDTGLEYPEIREFVKTKENVIWLKPKKSFKQVIEKHGYPVISKEVSGNISWARNKPEGRAAQKFNTDSWYCRKYGKRYDLSKWKFLLESDIPISDYCCDVLKKNPIKHYEKETDKKPILATMVWESALRRNSWFKSGCNGFNTKRPISQPLSFWTEQDILQYLKQFNIPYASIYGDIVENEHGELMTTGASRTGCMFCMFGVHLEPEPNRFQKMQVTHPKLWSYCTGGGQMVNGKWVPNSKGLGIGFVLDYIGVPWKNDEGLWPMKELIEMRRIPRKPRHREEG